MRSIEVIIIFPDFELLIQIDIIGIAQELIEFQIISPVRTLDLAIEPGSSRLDIYMPDPQILDMPVELSLELMAVVGPHCMNSEGKAVDHMIDKLDCRLLIVALIDPQSADSGGIIYGSVLETLDWFTFRGLECEEPNIDLDVMTWNLFLIAVSQDGPPLGIPWLTIEAKPAQRPVDTALRYCHLRVITADEQINPLWAQMIGRPQINNLFLDLPGQAHLGILRSFARFVVQGSLDDVKKGQGIGFCFQTLSKSEYYL